MKSRTVATCQSCGAQMPRWMGRCPECGEYGTVVEEKTSNGGPRGDAKVEMHSLAAHDLGESVRAPTWLPEVDLVLGGGLVPGSVVLLAGEPGIGKSTLTLQVALSLGTDRDVLLVCGEEAPAQVRARAERFGAVPDGVRTIDDPSLPAVLGALETGLVDVAVVDSIQTVFDPEIPSAPGSVAQVRECGARLARAAREHSVTVILVGHVTKEGTVAGPRVLEHLVDVVLQFEGERSGGLRVLRPLKNRFGATSEVGFFEMTSGGLQAIRDASRYLLADRRPGLPGSVLAACVDGRRPFVCEVQALVDGSNLAIPRRTALGVDPQRLPVLTAVVQRALRVSLGDKDVFVSAVGGMRAAEPAADLAVVLAMLSAVRGNALPDDLVAFGEVGLSGEVRQVVAPDRRLAEARGVGCRAALVPHNLRTDDDQGLELIRISDLRDARAAIERFSVADG